MALDAADEERLATCLAQLSTTQNSLQALQAKLDELEKKEPADSPKLAALETQVAEQAARLEETRSKVKRARAVLAKLHRPPRNEDDPPAPGPKPKPKTHSGLDWI